MAKNRILDIHRIYIDNFILTTILNGDVHTVLRDVETNVV